MRRKIFPPLVFPALLWYAGQDDNQGQEWTGWTARKRYWTNETIVRVIKEQAQQFIDDLFGKLRERMIDLRTGKAIFAGGGSILLRKQIEASGKIGSAIFVSEISANTKGYELLYRASQAGVR